MVMAYCVHVHAWKDIIIAGLILVELSPLGRVKGIESNL